MWSRMEPYTSRGLSAPLPWCSMPTLFLKAGGFNTREDGGNDGDTNEKEVRSHCRSWVLTYLAHHFCRSLYSLSRSHITRRPLALPATTTRIFNTRRSMMSWPPFTIVCNYWLPPPPPLNAFDVATPFTCLLDLVIWFYLFISIWQRDWWWDDMLNGNNGKLKFVLFFNFDMIFTMHRIGVVSIRQDTIFKSWFNYWFGFGFFFFTYSYLEYWILIIYLDLDLDLFLHVFKSRCNYWFYCICLCNF